MLYVLDRCQKVYNDISSHPFLSCMDVASSDVVVRSSFPRVYSTCSQLDLSFLRLRLGDVFGELSLLYDEPRSASIFATRDCRTVTCHRVSRSFLSPRSPKGCKSRPVQGCPSSCAGSGCYLVRLSKR